MLLVCACGSVDCEPFSKMTTVARGAKCHQQLILLSWMQTIGIGQKSWHVNQLKLSWSIIFNVWMFRQFTWTMKFDTFHKSCCSSPLLYFSTILLHRRVLTCCVWISHNNFIWFTWLYKCIKDWYCTNIPLLIPKITGRKNSEVLHLYFCLNPWVLITIKNG